MGNENGKQDVYGALSLLTPDVVKAVAAKIKDGVPVSLKYAFGKNQQAGSDQIEKPQMVELADACIKVCLIMNDPDFLFEEVFSWYDEHERGPLFVDVLEPYILDQKITSVIFIDRWVDFTVKYGLGYCLSDGSNGLYFNDATTLVTKANSR